MAKILPDSIVLPQGPRFADLNYPPAPTGAFAIAVHPGALRAQKNQATQVIQVNNDELLWVGSIDECMLHVSNATHSNARALLANHLLRGAALWSVITPGSLIRRPISYATTIYQGSRMWVVLGETSSALLAAPLNSGTKDSVYQIPVSAADLPAGVRSPSDSTLELNHLWSFPRTSHSLGTINPNKHARLADKTKRYYSYGPEAEFSPPPPSSRRLDQPRFRQELAGEPDRHMRPSAVRLRHSPPVRHIGSSTRSGLRCLQ